MFKKIFILIIIFIMNFFPTSSYLEKENKDKIDKLTKDLFLKIEKDYSIFQQKDILIKLNKKISYLKIKNKSNLSKLELFNYLQIIIKQELNKKNLALKNCNNYHIHNDISASIFWVWEWANDSNWYISNMKSAWDGDWYKNFKNWTENHFYIALPYNDFENWKRKNDVKNIPWYNNNIKDNESVVKNRWIKVEYNWKIAYGQWEDVWPFYEDDFDYVFWTKKPKNTYILKAWIDLSPKLADYVWFKGSWNVNWSFIEENCVPDWKWKNIITKNNINWK